MDLTKITTPFGLLDEVHGPGTRDALKAHGGPYEGFGIEGWEEYTPYWSPYLTVRVKPQPLTKPSIDWSHVAPQFKWLARDQDWFAYLYDCRPECGPGAWVGGHELATVTGFSSYTPGTCDWRDSLVQRPEGV